MSQIRVFLTVTVDTERFDLSSYRNEAVTDGFGDDDENGAWYLAQSIADENTAPGCKIEVEA